MVLTSNRNSDHVCNNADKRGAMRPIKSPFYSECSLTTSGDKLTLGRQLAYSTHQWMETHESAFRSIYKFVKDQQKDGLKSRLHDRVAIYCVDQNIRTDTKDYKFSNDIWTGIERYLVLVDPTLKHNPIQAKASAIDLYGLLPVSYLNLEQA